MKADYKIGVCISNEDPQNLGRIRAIPVDIIGKLATLKDIVGYVNREDEKAVTTLTYKPWYSGKSGDFKERDKYLCEPFLPKALGITPNPGQLVKIITYEDLGQKKEFIGPYTIDQITLNEEYRNVINNLEKNINVVEVLPKRGKTFVSGYSGEQMILGDNEFLMRLGHINSGNNTRKTSYPFIQLSQFSNSYTVKEKTTTITETQDINIDYICQLFLSYTPKSNTEDKNFTANIILFDASKQKNSSGKIGLTKNTYQMKESYINEGYQNYIVKHYVNSSSYNEFVKIIEEILISYNSGGVVKYFDVNNTSTLQRIDNEKSSIIVYNNIPVTPNAGGALNPSNVVFGMKNWIFRLKPGTEIRDYQGTLTRPNLPPQNIEILRYEDYYALDTFISKYGRDKNYGNLAINNVKTSTVTKPTAEPTKKPQSVHIIHSDKFLFLSSLNSLNLVDNLNYDGIPANKVAEYLNGTNPNVKTYGFVRGEKLMELLSEILDMFARHGHEAGKDPRASIVQSTQEAVENLKKKIKDELKESQNNVIVNHNFRLN